ncbi:MAG: hypothetical protein ACXWWU_00425 [Candidatus Limnocylindria bacterium]
MIRSRLLVCLPLAAAVALGVQATHTASASSPTTECGVVREYSPPDAGTSTPGAIAFGLSGPSEAVAADAALVGAVATNLPWLVGGTPTCLIVVRVSGLITSLEFAPSGTISGPVTFMADLLGPGQDAYIVGDRLLVPVDVLTVVPGLAALIVAPAEADTETSLTFQIDVASGGPSGFVGTTQLAGMVTIEDTLDVRIGEATLSAAVVDDAARAAFGEVAALGVPATVRIDATGSIDPDSGAVAVSLAFSIDYAVPPSFAAPSPPPAAMLPDTAMAPSP